MAYNEEVTMMMSVVPGSMTGISAMMGGLASITNVFTDITRQIDANFGLIDTSIITASTIVAQLGLSAAESFGKFEQGLKVAQMVSGQTAQEMDYLRNKANELSVSFRVDMDQITEGLQTLGRAGLNSASEQVEVLENGLSTAKLEGRDLNGVLEELIQNTALLGGDLKSSNFGESSKYLNDIMVATSMTAPITTHDVSETLKYSGGIAAAAGANVNTEEGKAILEDYMGAIAAFAQKGVTGSIAGTALRAFFNKPATQDSSVTDALASIHLKPEYLWEDDEQTMKPVSEQIRIIKDQMEELNVSTMDQLQIWSKIVGGKMGQQMMKLDSSSIKELTKDIHASNDAESLAAGTFDTYQMKMKEMTEQGQVAFRQFGEYAAKVLTPLLEVLKKIFEFFSNPIASIGLFVGALTLISTAISKARNVFGTLREEFSLIRNYFLEDEKLMAMRPSTARKQGRFKKEELERKYPGLSPVNAYARERQAQIDENLLETGLTEDEIYILRKTQGSKKKDFIRTEGAYSDANIFYDSDIAKTLIENKKWNSKLSDSFYKNGQNLQLALLENFDEVNNLLQEIANEKTKDIKKDIKSESESFKKKEFNKDVPFYAPSLEEKEMKAYEDFVVPRLENLQKIDTFDEKGMYNDIRDKKRGLKEAGKTMKNANTAYGEARVSAVSTYADNYVKHIEKTLGEGFLDLNLDRGDLSFDDVDFLMEALVANKKIPNKPEITNAIEENIRGRIRLEKDEFLYNRYKKSAKLLNGSTLETALLSRADFATQMKEMGIDLYGKASMDEFQRYFLEMQGLNTPEKILQSASSVALGNDVRPLSVYELEKLFPSLRKEDILVEDLDYDTNGVPIGPNSNYIYDEKENTYNPVLAANKKERDAYKKLQDEEDAEDLRDSLEKEANARIANAQAMIDEEKERQKEQEKVSKTLEEKAGTPVSGYGPKERLFDTLYNEMQESNNYNVYTRDELKKSWTEYQKSGLPIENYLKKEDIVSMIQKQYGVTLKGNRAEIVEQATPFLLDWGGRGKDSAKKEELKNIGELIGLEFDEKEFKKMNKDEIIRVLNRKLYGDKVLKLIDDIEKASSHAGSMGPVPYNIADKEKREDLVNQARQEYEDAEAESLERFEKRKKYLEDENKLGVVQYGNGQEMYETDRKRLEIEQEIATIARTRADIEKDPNHKANLVEQARQEHADAEAESLKRFEQHKKDVDNDKSDLIKQARQEYADAETAALEAARRSGARQSTLDYIEDKKEEKETLKKVLEEKEKREEERRKEKNKKPYKGGYGGFLPGSSQYTAFNWPFAIDESDWIGYEDNLDSNKFAGMTPSSAMIYYEAHKNDKKPGFFSNLLNDFGQKSGGFFDGLTDRNNRMLGFKRANDGTLNGFKKLGNAALNISDLFGGPFFAAIELGTVAIEMWQQAFQSYCEDLKKADSELKEAYSEWNSAEDSLRRTYQEGNPDATSEEIDQMVYDTYSTMQDDMANAVRNGQGEWLKKIDKEAEKGTELVYDEEKDDGSRVEKEEEEISAEEEYEKALKENTGALYAATAKLNVALSKMSGKMTDSWWGLDGWTGWLTDQWGGAMNKLATLGGSKFSDDNEFLLTQSQSDENYSGYTEMAGLMLEDFKDAGGNWIKGMRTMMGDDVDNLAKIVPQSGKDWMYSLANSSTGIGSLSARDNAKIQASMKNDPKTWQKLAREYAKRDVNKKEGKSTQKNLDRIKGLVSKLQSTLGNGFNETHIRQAAYLMQMQEMYQVAQNTMVPIMANNTSLAGSTLLAANGISTKTGTTSQNTGGVWGTAEVISGLVAIIAKTKAKEVAWQTAYEGDPDSTDLNGDGHDDKDKAIIELAQKSTSADDFAKTAAKMYNQKDVGLNPYSRRGVYSDRSRAGLTSDEGENKAPALFIAQVYEAAAKMTGYGYSAAEANKFAQNAIKNLTGKESLADIYNTFGKNYTENPAFHKMLVDNYLNATDEEEGDGSNLGSGSGDKDKDNTGTKKERVDLVLCSKKEIPKLNVNLFKKPPTFTVLNKNFKVRDVKINTEDTPKAIMSAIKNSFIDVQKRSDPKIIQDEDAVYDPEGSTEGNPLPSGTAKTRTD